MKTKPICAYCGKAWPRFKGDTKDIPAETAAEIASHTQKCKKNPLVIEISSLRQQLAEREKKSYTVAKNCEVLFKNYWMNATAENRKAILKYTRSFHLPADERGEDGFQ